MGANSVRHRPHRALIALALAGALSAQPETSAIVRTLAKRLDDASRRSFAQLEQPLRALRNHTDRQVAARATAALLRVKG